MSKDRNTNSRPSPAPPPESKEEAKIKPYRRCPRCWGTNRGIGESYTTHGAKTYYKCSRSALPGGGACGFTWVAQTVSSEEVVKVSHRRVFTEHQDPGDISQR